MKFIVKITIVTALLLTISCGKGKSKLTDNRPVVEVKTGTPISLQTNFISVSGKIEASQNANLSTRLMGYVDKIYVKVGDKVTKGQLLLKLSNSDIQSQKAQAEAAIIEATAAFTNAEKDYKRFSALFSQQSASQKELDDVTANYNMAKARLEAANQQKNRIIAQLAYTAITAPFSGVITGKFINKGDMAAPGKPLLGIENPSKFQVMAMVPESEINSIKKDSQVKVLLKSQNQHISGTLTEISSSAKNTGGQFLIKILLDKTNTKFMSGMFVSVQIPINNLSDSGILIPKSALIKKGELTGIYTVSQSNTALLRWVRTGKTYGNNIEILSGLSTDEPFIVSATSKLTNGAKLKIQ